MDQYSNLPTTSLEILIKTDADVQVKSLPAESRFGPFAAPTTLLPPSYVHWWTYYCQNFEKQALWTFFDPYPSCHFMAKYPRYRSRFKIPDDPE